MAGYWNQPGHPQGHDPDGLAADGDAARTMSRATSEIVDRIADRFFSDGRPVYPAEVERY